MAEKVKRSLKDNEKTHGSFGGGKRMRKEEEFDFNQVYNNYEKAYKDVMNEDDNHTLNSKKTDLYPNTLYKIVNVESKSAFNSLQFFNAGVGRFNSFLNREIINKQKCLCEEDDCFCGDIDEQWKEYNVMQINAMKNQITAPDHIRREYFDHPEKCKDGFLFYVENRFFKLLKGGATYVPLKVYSAWDLCKMVPNLERMVRSGMKPEDMLQTDYAIYHILKKFNEKSEAAYVADTERLKKGDKIVDVVVNKNSRNPEETEELLKKCNSSE